ncbi:DNA repair protein RadC [Ignavibacterium sp.]|uniref:RadC family protein n=1 Tax=Ignavibacterium sp. TaxID=2651167 RepID=UPI0026147660|nr:DNA repair protein RadC [Ignavibacterium sp.]
MSQKVKDLPLDDRPREKLILRGPQSLSDAELIAILLRTGMKGKSVLTIAQEMINKEGNLAVLSSKSHAALIKTSGIGKDKAATLVAAFELAKRILHQQKWLFDKKITSPSDVAEIYIPLLKNETKEQFWVLCLNNSNKIIKQEAISIGNLNSSVVHQREVFKVAIDNNAASLILMHNHPSGNPEPSNEDIVITRKLVEAGKIMDIPIFDHIIIAGNNYTSFVERRLI